MLLVTQLECSCWARTVKVGGTMVKVMGVERIRKGKCPGERERSLLGNERLITSVISFPSNWDNTDISLFFFLQIVHLRHRLDNAVSSSRDRAFPLETVVNMIQALIDCDEFQDIATLRVGSGATLWFIFFNCGRLQNLDELLDHKSDLSEKLCQIGDSIVYKLVQWTKRLPFYLELPVEVHTRLLTHKWHELLVLTTSAYQAIHGVHKLSSTSTAGQEADFTQEVGDDNFAYKPILTHFQVSNNLVTLQTCLTSMMGRPITMDQLRQDVGLMVEKITHVTLMFRRVKLRMEEYVCLKVITMLSQNRGASTELEAIQDRYMTCLKNYLDHTCPQQPSRFQELLLRLPEVCCTCNPHRNVPKQLLIYRSSRQLLCSWRAKCSTFLSFSIQRYRGSQVDCWIACSVPPSQTITSKSPSSYSFLFCSWYSDKMLFLKADSSSNEWCATNQRLWAII